jgi:drug/metabolite transporter (DMT)-like permease
MTQTRPWGAVLAAVTGSVLVGCMPILARHLYANGVGPASMLFWRYAIALPALFAAAAATRVDWLDTWRGGAWKIGLVGATLGAGQTICFWQSIRTLDTSVAVLLFYTYPALTLVLDRLFLQQPIRARVVLCVAVILVGAGLITLPGLRGGALDPRGLAWALPGPLIYSFYLAANSVLLRRHKPLAGGFALYCGMVLSFGLVCLVQGLDVPAEPDIWLLLVFVALGPGALTITLFSYSVPLLGPSSYAIIANMELVTVVSVGVTLLGEPVTLNRAIGGGLIVAGILGYGLLRQPQAMAPHPSPLPAGGEREGPASARG